jgi:hypothetical protein
MSTMASSCGLPEDHDGHWSTAPVEGLIESGVWCDGNASVFNLPDLPAIQADFKTYRTESSCETVEWHRPHWVTKPHVSLPGSGVYCMGHAQPEEDEEDQTAEIFAWCDQTVVHEPHWSRQPTTEDPGAWCLGEKRPVMKIRPIYRGMEAIMLGYFEQRGIDLPVYTNGNKGIEEAQELAEAWAEGDRDHIMQEIADLAIVAAVAAKTQGTTVEECVALKTAKDAGRGPKIKVLDAKAVATILFENGWRNLPLDHERTYQIWYRDGDEIVLPTDPDKGDYDTLLARAARLAVSAPRTNHPAPSKDHLVSTMLNDGWHCTTRATSFERFVKNGRAVIVPTLVDQADFDRSLAVAYSQAGVATS